MARMIQEHQVSVKKKPTVKRLKKKAKSISDSKKNTPQSAVKKSNAQANGNSAFSMDNDSNDSQEWKEYSQFVHGNGVDTSGEPGRCKARPCVSVGKCFLTCLYGRVEVMGFTIEEGQESYPLFSPASHCPLTIRALQSSDQTRDDRSEVLPILRKYLPSASRKRLLKRIMSNSSVILLEPMETPLTRFLTSFTDLGELFSPPMSELMSAVLDTPLNGLGMIPLVSNIEGLNMSKSYRDALNTVVSACRGDMDGCAVILVCGTKNVGKSTFIRILINTLLNHTTSVDYLEGDLGQTEFTPAGCLSLSTVREPLLGPPFTHQCTPEHMIYYGQSSCESDLDRYLESLKSLWRRRSQSREAPVIINTMGWVKGFGFQLLVDMIRFFPLSHVVQLGHGGTTQCAALSPEFLRTAHGHQTHPPAQTAMDEFTESHSPPRSYTHLIVQAEFQGVGRQGTGVPHTAVALGVIHCEVVPSHMFYAANASLVGLCCLGEKVTSRGGPVMLSQAPICPCVGFGTQTSVSRCVQSLSQSGFEGEKPYVTTGLQFRRHRCRKAASLQGNDEAQSNGDVMTFAAQHRFIALYSFGPVSIGLLNVQT
ncbi:Polynucleotide 5'-hydroxyl-kinase NOL9 [Larimichthys crocea]|uniref:Uncharacterized protein n=1 Tax=Larimichthys crocea TaxID=215358 RepID=A0ACD3RAT0_LARCR|nr:Polynucleotide 5'-hydroxyl-kinase NOL9 [Larimichthys crocea]